MVNWEKGRVSEIGVLGDEENKVAWEVLLTRVGHHLGSRLSSLGVQKCADSGRRLCSLKSLVAAPTKFELGVRFAFCLLKAKPKLERGF